MISSSYSPPLGVIYPKITEKSNFETAQVWKDRVCTIIIF